MPPRHPAPPLVPIIIGINGRRDLKGRAGEIEGELYAKLKGLTETFPHAPLMVLTSLAEGADWCAARAVARLTGDLRAQHLDRVGYFARSVDGGDRDLAADDMPRVALVCPLPFALDIYEEDFPEEHRQRVRVLLEQRQIAIEGVAPVELNADALICFPLAPLVGSAQSEMHRIGGPLGPDGPQRSLHYEQVGVFVADHCHLLISVMEADAKPGSVGGTARIVHYKCTGGLPDSREFDTQIAAFTRVPEVKAQLLDTPALNLPIHQLRAASRELTGGHEPSDWFSQSRGYVWHLTLPQSPAEIPTWRALTGREPEWKGRILVDSADKKTYRAFDFTGPNDDGPRELTEKKEQNATSLFRRVNRFDRRVLEHEADHPSKSSPPRWWQRLTQHVAQAGEPAKVTMEDSFFFEAATDIEQKINAAPPSTARSEIVHREGTLYIERLMTALSNVQGKTNTGKKWSLLALALCFFLSVGLFSAYKMMHDRAFLAVLYLGVIAFAVVAYLVARITQVSARHQEYRAAAEALRVLTGWRLAGMPDRIEDYYVPGTMKELERVRDGVRMISAHVSLRHRVSPLDTLPSDLSLARKHWSTNQKDWFHLRLHDKELEAKARISGFVSIFSLGTGIFFGTLWPTLYWPIALLAGLAAPALLVLTGLAYLDKHPGLRHRIVHVLASRPTVGRKANSLFAWWDRLKQKSGRRLKDALTLSWALFPFVLAAILTSVAMALLGDGHAHGDAAHAPHGKPLTATQWLGLATAILNGLAGALVYLFEKSAVESEARNYDEMQHVFASAEQMLDATEKATHLSATDKLAQQHRILRELGRAALAENSYWLRAHRERPVEPIAGG